MNLSQKNYMNSDSDKKDILGYYKILGVSPSATAQEIKKSFRKMSLTAHPDKGGSEE